MSVADDHTDAIDPRAHHDGAENKFSNNSFYDNPGSSNHFAHGGDVNFASWAAKTHMEGETITADVYVPAPVVVV
jgi:hypothetical protein